MMTIDVARMTRATVLAACAAASGYVRNAAADVPLPLAVEAAQTAIDACRANGYHVTVTVMDPDFSIRLVLRDDGAGERTVEVGRRKAYTVIKTGMSSRDFAKTLPPGPPAPAAPSAGPPPLPGPINGDASLISWPGGLPVSAGGKVIGAISASGAPGGEKDEACLNAGLATIADRLK
jgi:uncharacterized protein GlcG (DUF336 family)